MSNAKKPIVHLRVYKGLKLFYDANGKVMNPNQVVKLTYNTIEWKNFIKNLSGIGFNSVEVEKVLSGDTLEEIEMPKEILEEVKNIFKAKERELTPEQKEIAELRAIVAGLTEKKEVAKEVGVLDKLRAEYKSISGEKAHHLWGENKLTELIEELKSKK